MPGDGKTDSSCWKFWGCGLRQIMCMVADCSMNKGGRLAWSKETTVRLSIWDIKYCRPYQETKDTCHLAVIRLQPDPREQPEKTQDVKMQDTQAPRSRGAYQRNYFIEPLILPSSHTKKSIKFLEISSFLQLTIIFTPSNHLPFIAKLYPSSPLTSLEQFSVGYWRCCLPDLTS